MFVTVNINGVNVTGAPLEYLTSDPVPPDGRFWVRTDLIGATAPNAPSPSIATVSTQNTLTWTAVPGASSYNIYWLTGATDPTKLTGTKITGATSPYVHSSLTNGTTYRYIVTSVNNVGESPASSAVNASPSSSADTTAPVITVFTAGTTTGLSVPITFTATDAVGVTGWMIKEVNSTPASGDSGWLGSVPTSYTTGSAGTKALYGWAKDGAGNVSAVSTIASVVFYTSTIYTFDGATGTAPPAAFTVVTANGGTVDLDGTGNCKIYTTENSQRAQLYATSPVSKTTSKHYRVKLRAAMPANGSMQVFNIIAASGTTPPTAQPTDFIAQIKFVLNTTRFFHIDYFNTTGTAYYYSGSSWSIYDQSLLSWAEGTDYNFHLYVTSTGIRIEITEATDTTKLVTMATEVPWTSINAGSSNPLWLFVGDWSSTVNYGTMLLADWEES
jgi:hypothetical protein